MKKILFLSPLPPPYYGSALSSKACLTILKNARDIKVFNIKLNRSREISDIGKITFPKIKGIFEVRKEIRKFFSDFSPEVVYVVPATHGLGLIRDCLIVQEIRKYWKGEILFHVRSRILEKDKRNYFYRSLLKKMFNNSKVIVVGNALKKDFADLGVRKIFVLYNAIKNEVKDFEIRKILEKRKNHKELNLLFLSNMDPSKGWIKLLEACKILSEKNVPFRCDFIGEWPSQKYKDFFDSFVRGNNLGRKVFSYGKVVGEKKNKFLENADILIFPTEYSLETFGRVILEAMMYALPVIANSIASIPEIVDDGITGYLLKRNTPEEIASKIELLRNFNRRKRAGLMGRERFKNLFELGSFKKKFLEIINSF